jgi:putative glutamine amidotransferase
VVITGGHDVDPVLYAQESKVLPRYDPSATPSSRG